MNLAWLKLRETPITLNFYDSILCMNRIVEILSQLELEAAAVLSHAGATSFLTAALNKARLVDHLLDKVLEAGDAHADSIERRPILLQADSLGGKSGLHSKGPGCCLGDTRADRTCSCKESSGRLRAIAWICVVGGERGTAHSVLTPGV